MYSPVAASPSRQPFHRFQFPFDLDRRHPLVRTSLQDERSKTLVVVDDSFYGTLYHIYDTRDHSTLYSTLPTYATYSVLPIDITLTLLFRITYDI